jgi:Uma2 family endonuclease
MYALRASNEPELDERVILHDISWSAFEALLDARGESSVPRMYFLDGEVELLSPAHDHEIRKTTLARLLELWALETGTSITGVGSWTLKNRPKKAGAEPDECYIIGDEDKRTPDLVIEVEWSRTVGLDKREIYARLGVRELWTLTAEGRLVVRVLHGEKYVESKKSKALPKLDVQWLLSFAMSGSQNKAVRALQAALRKKR